jgi:NADPH-dependent curcumin reductase CurA
MTGREVRLASRPRGWPTAANFELATVDVPPPADGQVLVRNQFISVDPYMRGRMNDVKSYVAPFSVGRVMTGGAVGEVIDSKVEGIAPGDAVLSVFGWRELFVAPAKDLTVVDRRVKPLSAFLGVLGTTGMTAWIGLELVDVKAGDRVFVSGAAGAVGSIACQLAKRRGCFVVGSAGSDEKVRILMDEFGVDAAFNYKNGELTKQLAAAAPEGIDVYFDNVGGEHLEAAMNLMREQGRLAICGAISRYNDEQPSPGPRNITAMIAKRLTMKGFLVFDWNHRRGDFLEAVVPLVMSGELRVKETVVEGLERAPEAFIDLLRGANVGKMVVKV